jgi:hypothetical protein
MQRRRFSREFKLEAVKLVGKRGVSSAMRASTHHQLFLPVFFGWFGIGGFRRRTPGPPPFSAMNSMPAVSRAAMSFSPVSTLPPSGPSSDSSRAIVGSDTPDAVAKSPCDQATSARAAFI